MTDTGASLSFAMLLQRVKSGGHFGELLDAIDDARKIILLSHTGLKDAPAMLRKPRRLGNYVKTHLPRLSAWVVDEEAARDIVLTWAICEQATASPEPSGLPVAPDDETVIPLTEPLLQDWACHGRWWKVALWLGAAALTRGIAEFGQEQLDRILDGFETGFPEILAALLHGGDSSPSVVPPGTFQTLLDLRSRLQTSLHAALDSLDAPPRLAGLVDAEQLANNLRELRRLYSELQAKLDLKYGEVAVPDGVVPPKECETIEQLVATEEALQRALAAREQARQSRALRDEVASVLGPLVNLQRVDGREMAELAPLRAEAESLLAAAERVPLPADVEEWAHRVRTGSHPLAVLSKVVSGQMAGADDTQWTTALDIVREAFGRAIAGAAMRGALHILQADRVPEAEVTDIQKAVATPPTTAVEPSATTVPAREKVPTVEPPAVELQGETTDQPVGVEPPSLPPPEDERHMEEPTVSVEQAAIPPEVATGVAPKEEWEELFWSLVREDLPAAYWLARALEEQKSTPPVPSWQVEALQGSRWLSDSRDRVAGDLTQIVLEHQVGSDQVHRLFGTAAALVPAVVAPSTGMSEWLHAAGLEALHELVEAVRTFANSGYGLRPEDLTGVVDKAQVAAAISSTVQRATRWLKEAPTRRMPYYRATGVWRTWTGGDGVLHQLVAPVASNDSAAVDQALEKVADWRRRPLVERVHRDDPLVRRQGAKPIFGASLQRLVSEAEEAIELVEEWCELHRRLRDLEVRGDWFHRQVQQLIDGFRASLPHAESDLKSIVQEGSSEPLTTVVQLVLESIHKVAALLTLDTGSAAQRAPTQGVLTHPSPGLSGGLARHLLWFPELKLDDDGLPTPSALPQLPELLRAAHAGKPDLRGLLEKWFARQDYRFVDAMLEALNGEPDAANLRRSAREAESGSEATFLDRWHQVADGLAQAVVDEVLSEEQRSEYDGELQNIQKAADKHNYRILHQRLRAMEEKLEQAREDRLMAQKQEWQAVERMLSKSGADKALREGIVSTVQQSLVRRDTVVAADLIAHLREALDRGHPPDATLFVSPKPQRDVFCDFMTSLPGLAELIFDRGLPKLARAIKEEKGNGRLSLAGLSKPRLREAADALLAWSELTTPPYEEPVNRERLATVLCYLGFTFSGDPAEAIEQSERGPDWAHLRVRMSAGDLSPVPNFGSTQDARFDVVCQWERPAADVIGGMLHHLRLHHQSILLLYFGRLGSNRRWQLAQYARKERLAVAVLDESLLLFLAQERDSRLPIFLRCALPFAAINPYVATGTVPREMFFGRQDTVQSLQDPAGRAMVFGGRQLGKSALLRHVQREFHRPEQGRYAIYEDVILVGDPTSTSSQSCEALWPRLRDSLTRVGVLKKQGEAAETILSHIREAMEQQSGRRVLVLLDEADKFLNSDAAQGFTVVKNLKRLMDDTQRRFKVVFAGLHNVQQYQNIPNQPLAHLQPLVVGPLEPRAARELVEVPMTALGFRFADEQSIPRILAYTNYHPGLIQLFCHELVEALLGRPATSLSDLEIRQGDVEAVYRRAEVQLAIRDRFDWTLALDARYQLLALSLVYDQMAEHDGYSRAYGLAEVLALGRYWWPQGFDRVETDQLQGILDDMCGLGVLVRNSSDHRYRLRSPNLVRLMGSAGDIELALLTLSEKPAAIEGVKGDSHHTLLDDPTLIYSPFTYAQARKLKAKQFGVGLVFGSDALGLRHVKEASRQFVAPDSPTDKTGAWEEMRSVAISAETTRQGLQRFWSRHQDCSRLIAYRAMRGSGEQLLEQVTAVIDFCAKHARSQRQWLRVLLAFDPSATWEWVHLAADLRVELEQKADAVVWLHRWDEDGLKQLLEQHGKRATSKGLQRLLSETGGWPIVLHRLATTWSKDQDDPTEGLESLQSNLYGPDGELRQEVLGALGLSEDPIIKQALHDISRCAEPIEPGDLPIIMEGERAPSEAECVRLCEYLVGLGILQQSDAGLSVEPLVSRLLSANHVS